MSRMTPARHLAGSAPRCSIKASQTAPGPGHGWVPKPCGNEWRENWKNKGRSELLPGAHGRLPTRQRVTEEGDEISSHEGPTVAVGDRGRYDLKLWTGTLHESATYPPA